MNSVPFNLRTIPVSLWSAATRTEAYLAGQEDSWAPVPRLAAPDRAKVKSILAALPQVAPQAPEAAAKNYCKLYEQYGLAGNSRLNLKGFPGPWSFLRKIGYLAQSGADARGAPSLMQVSLYGLEVRRAAPNSTAARSTQGDFDALCERLKGDFRGICMDPPAEFTPACLEGWLERAERAHPEGKWTSFLFQSLEVAAQCDETPGWERREPYRLVVAQLVLRDLQEMQQVENLAQRILVGLDRLQRSESCPLGMSDLQAHFVRLAQICGGCHPLLTQGLPAVAEADEALVASPAEYLARARGGTELSINLNGLFYVDSEPRYSGETMASILKPYRATYSALVAAQQTKQRGPVLHLTAVAAPQARQEATEAAKADEHYDIVIDLTGKNAPRGVSRVEPEVTTEPQAQHARPAFELVQVARPSRRLRTHWGVEDQRPQSDQPRDGIAEAPVDGIADVTPDYEPRVAAFLLEARDD